MKSKQKLGRQSVSQPNGGHAYAINLAIEYKRVDTNTHIYYVCVVPKYYHVRVYR